MILLNPIDLIMFSYWRGLLLALVHENGQSEARAELGARG